MGEVHQHLLPVLVNVIYVLIDDLLKHNFNWVFSCCQEKRLSEVIVACIIWKVASITLADCDAESAISKTATPHLLRRIISILLQCALRISPSFITKHLERLHVANCPWSSDYKKALHFRYAKTLQQASFKLDAQVNSGLYLIRREFDSPSDTVFRLQIAIKEFDIMLQFGIIKPCHGIKELLPSKSKVLSGANMRGEKSAEQVASSISAHHYTYEESSLSLHQHYSTSEQRFLEFRNEPHVCY
ncbi:hypothetical protein T08_10974 [Trichinella sp. T8]|nr:hypothetical protein T08_10974 [Trichinella sp. T8]